MTLRKTSIYLIPILFFGYSILFNIALFLPVAKDTSRLDWDVGAVRGSINDLYSDQQLHGQFAQSVFGAIRYLLLREGREGVVVGPNGWLLSQEEFRPPLAPEEAADLRQNIVSLAREVTAHGKQIVVLLLPSKAESLGLGQNPVIAREKKRLIKSLRAANIAFIDAAPALKGPKQFFKTDTHWTPQGAGNVAQLIAQTFPSLSGTQVVSETPASPQEFSGDLISFVTTPGFAPVIGLPAEVAHVSETKIDDPKTLDLFGAPTSAHALVGTSYSANPRWGFESALRRHLSHEILNFAESGQGPLAPMRSYLSQKRADLKGAVIWEIPVRYLTDPTICGAQK